jgi:transcriptional regulator with XRE-family HTH domain
MITNYEVLCSIMQDFSRELRKFMDSKSLSQAELANAAGVNQGTVSRALRRKPAKHSEAVMKLCRYAGINFESSSQSTTPDSVKEAFERVWDGTNEHALAITRIIEATHGLRPRQG